MSQENLDQLEQPHGASWEQMVLTMMIERHESASRWPAPSTAGKNAEAELTKQIETATTARELLATIELNDRAGGAGPVVDVFLAGFVYLRVTGQTTTKRQFNYRMRHDSVAVAVMTMLEDVAPVAAGDTAYLAGRAIRTSPQSSTT